MDGSVSGNPGKEPRRVMLSDAMEFMGGLVLLLVGGRLLVSASVDTAKRLAVSPLVVGLTLVAWGTSAPELALNLASASKGRGDLALGNVVGANICNMALVLGICALIRPLLVQERLVRVEIVLNAAGLSVMSLLGLTIGFQRWFPGLLLFLFGVYSAWTVMSALRGGSNEDAVREGFGDDPTREVNPMGWLMIVTCFIGGLALLTIGGSLASDGASGIAIGLGVPVAVVGVTIVSIGTTLPELTTSFMAIRRGQTDLAMGNAIGSCMFNAGAIFGITGLLAPPETGSAMTLPIVYMGLLAAVLVPISRTNRRRVSRIEGAALLATYAVFLAVSGLMALGGR